jgi:hypothetical protein
MTLGPPYPSTSPVSVVHAYIEYTGELVCAPRWNKLFGKPLLGDLTGLAQVRDDQMVNFIRDLLRRPTP